MPHLKNFCPLCQRDDIELLSQNLRRGDGSVWFCPSCDIGFLANRDFDPINYYRYDYRKTVSHKSEPSATNPEEIFSTYVEKQMERLHEVTPFIKRESKFLELGASAGQFIHHILGKCDSINAVELDNDCKLFLEKFPCVDVSGEPLGSSHFYGSEFDVICAFQVMEHVSDPIKFLREIYKSLAPGGVAFVEVPNLCDPLLALWDIKEYKDFYYHEDHLFYFSEKSLTLCASAAGFDNNKISFNFTQDYNLLNHLHWITMRQPQHTCEIGLSPINIGSDNAEITTWLSDKLTELDTEYRRKLAHLKMTSNIMMKLIK